jgi:hypothetical protein
VQATDVLTAATVIEICDLNADEVETFLRRVVGAQAVRWEPVFSALRYEERSWLINAGQSIRPTSGDRCIRASHGRPTRQVRRVGWRSRTALAPAEAPNPHLNALSSRPATCRNARCRRSSRTRRRAEPVIRTHTLAEIWRRQVVRTARLVRPVTGRLPDPKGRDGRAGS